MTADSFTNLLEVLGAWMLCDPEPGHVHGRAGGQLHLRGVWALLGPGRHRLQTAPALAPASQVCVTPWRYQLKLNYIIQEISNEYSL